MVVRKTLEKANVWRKNDGDEERREKIENDSEQDQADEGKVSMNYDAAMENTRRLTTGEAFNKTNWPTDEPPQSAPNQEKSGDDWADASNVGTGQLFWDRQYSRFS
jgi:hypothetical protein